MQSSRSAPPILRPDPVPPDPDAWLTPEETSSSIGVTPKTLANMRCMGKGPCFHKLGGKVWYLGKDILAYRRRRRFIASGVRDEG